MMDAAGPELLGAAWPLRIRSRPCAATDLWSS